MNVSRLNTPAKRELRGQKLPGWAFWLLWMGANAIGGATGVALSNVLALWSPSCSFIFGPAIALWIPLGLAQGLVLSLFLRRIFVPWMLASASGGFLGVVFAFPVGALWGFRFSLALSLAVMGAAGGLVVGFFQMLALVDRVSKLGRWILASTVGWAIALLIEGSTGLSGIWALLLGRGDVLQGTVIILIAAAISGLALTWMLAYTPSNPSSLEKAVPALNTSRDDGTPFALKQDSAEDKHEPTTS